MANLTSASVGGTVGLAATISTPSPQGIAAAIARHISSGELAPGERLPTVRDLAAQLGVSPATVSHAWQALARAGMIVSRGRSGSFVRSTAAPWLPRSMRELAGHVSLSGLDLSRGTPDPALLPNLAPAFSRITLRADTGSYADVPVIPELEETLRASWPFPVESVTIVDGALDGISRTLDQLVRFGDRVAVESPGFPPIFDIVELLGAELVPLALDEQGIRPESLRAALASAPAALVLQPRAHNPTGISMTPARAHELARLIATSRSAPDVVVIEDDHSGEISMAPDVSLGTWLPERVIHIRSFSKSHGPDLRIAALGGPAALVDRIVARRILGPGWTSRMLQAILHDLLTDPTSRAEVEHARSTYHERQNTLVAELTHSGRAQHVADGINTWVPVANERAATVQLAAAGIRVAEGAAFLATGDDSSANFIRVTVGMLREDAESAARSLAAAAQRP
jgi:DNA-binding transcriptional MocR family regulator